MKSTHKIFQVFFSCEEAAITSFGVFEALQLMFSRDNESITDSALFVFALKSDLFHCNGSYTMKIHFKSFSILENFEVGTFIVHETLLELRFTTVG